jgi:hypothetical protein
LNLPLCLFDSNNKRVLLVEQLKDGNWLIYEDAKLCTITNAARMQLRSELESTADSSRECRPVGWPTMAAALLKQHPNMIRSMAVELGIPVALADELQAEVEEVAASRRQQRERKAKPEPERIPPTELQAIRQSIRQARVTPTQRSAARVKLRRVRDQVASWEEQQWQAALANAAELNRAA